MFLFSEFTYRCNLETRRVMKNYIINTSACTLWGYNSCQNNRRGHGLTFSLDELIIFTSRPLNLHVNQPLNFFWESGPVYILISLYNYTPSCDKNPGDPEVWIMLIVCDVGRWVERMMNYVIHSIYNDIINCACWKVNGLIVVC